MEPAQHGKRTKEATAGNISTDVPIKIGGEFKINPNPSYIKERITFFEEVYNKQLKELEALEKKEISITLPDGKVIKGKGWETTPADIAKGISKKLLENSVAAKVTYSSKIKGPFDLNVIHAEEEEDHKVEGDQSELYDLKRRLQGDCKLELLNFEDPLGKSVFWHSSAHLLGAALEVVFGGHLTIGPALEDGFYYDAYIGNEKADPSQFPKIEEAVQKLAKESSQFQKVYLTKQQALELFKANPFKVQLISNKIPENAVTTAYRCGPFVDLCTGPHLPSTDRIKAFKVSKASGAYWLGKQGNDDLQRVYGIAFPSEKLLKEHEKFLEEVAKRNHRNIGKHQELFMFNTESPGSAFFYPHGSILYNRLVELMRREYKYRGYSEVHSPTLYNCHLWKVSGHWQKYKENMFLTHIEKEDYGVKPMNCPGHCLMFDSIQRSYKELPIRYADFGVLHRNEVSGALTGLTRVRRFCQDDAHIFCTADQIMEEVASVLKFLQYIYSIFGFEYKMELSTRPDNHLGEKELWDKAEGALAQALDKLGIPWKINPGDGAFYGPKIDIKLYDALKREFQCGTVQLDFNLPIRFNLQYKAVGDESEEAKEEEAEEGEHAEKPKAEAKPKAKKGKQEKGEKVEKAEASTEVKPEGKVEEIKPEHPEHHVKEHHAEKEYEIGEAPVKHGFQRPVIIHRAILGSIERFFAILCEHTSGKWPFWISPRQIIVVPVSEKYIDYAEALYHRFKLEGYAVEIDRSNFTLNKKVRNAQLAQFNYIAVVGEEERATETIDLRDRDKKDRLGKYTIPDFLKLLTTLKPPKSEAEIELEKKAYYEKADSKAPVVDEELKKLDEELKLKFFLEGEGFDLGARDKEVFEKLKSSIVDGALYPHLQRWHKYLSHKHGAN